jgi:DNA-binding transcriptional LysR family regulator
MNSDMSATMVNAPGDLRPAPAIEAPRPNSRGRTQRLLQGPGDVDQRTEVRSRRGVPVDSLSALGVFMRAAESRSFTNAGRQLSISSSAVGKAISRLEDRLGVRLFHRNTRAITLTPEGELFLESCRRIFSEINRIEQEFATQGSPKGKFKVSLPLLGMLMMPTLQGFLKEFPEIELDMDFTDHLVDVIDGGYDAVVRTGESTDSRLMSRRLGTYRLEVVGSPLYFAKAGIPTTPAGLVAHSCLHHRYPTSGKLQRWPFAKSGPYADVTLPIVAAVSTIEPLVSLAELGIGIACVPDFAVRRQIAEGSLVRILDGYVEHSGIFRAVWPSSQHMSPKLRAFLDYMAKHLFPKVPPDTPHMNGARSKLAAPQVRA